MRYVSRQIEIEAIQWNGLNYSEIKDFTNKNVNIQGVDDLWIFDTLQNCCVHANKGDFIIKGTKGEFYPCDPQVFMEKYERITE